jgi:hypothetical protein
MTRDRTALHVVILVILFLLAAAYVTRSGRYDPERPNYLPPDSIGVAR